MDNILNPGAQRLIGFYQGKYPLVPLGKNGTQIFPEDLSSEGFSIPNVKNNNNSNSKNEQANQAIMLDDQVIAIDEGSNGVMFHYVKDLSSGEFPCAGGIVFEDSPNDIFVGEDYMAYDRHFANLFVADGTNGTVVMRYRHPRSSYTPSYELEWDADSKIQTIPGGSDYLGKNYMAERYMLRN